MLFPRTSGYKYRTAEKRDAGCLRPHECCGSLYRFRCFPFVGRDLKFGFRLVLALAQNAKVRIVRVPQGLGTLFHSKPMPAITAALVEATAGQRLNPNRGT